MATTPDLIVKRFPEFMMLTNERIEMAILESTIIMGDDVDRWFNQETYYMANSYLVAHLLAMAEGSASGDDNALNPIRKTAVDNVEVEYAVPTGIGFNDTSFASTTYGRQYLFYRNMCFTGGIAV